MSDAVTIKFVGAGSTRHFTTWYPNAEEAGKRLIEEGYTTLQTDLTLRNDATGWTVSPYISTAGQWSTILSLVEAYNDQRDDHA